MADWKAHELFEREVAVLRGLEHPAIPRYIDSFLDEDSDDPCMYLAMEFIEGSTLREIIDGAEPWDSAQVRQLLDEMLDVLEYLHGHTPPVLHRDIKPSNIIRRPNGAFALVDFGAVQTLGLTDTGGSTVVGTSSYLPLEQLRGRAVPASGLHALGATLVHVATKRDPNDVETDRGTLQYQTLCSLSPELFRAIDLMIAPHVEDRAASAAAVRKVIESSEAVSPAVFSTALIPFPTDDATVIARATESESQLQRLAHQRPHSKLAGVVYKILVHHEVPDQPPSWDELPQAVAQAAQTIGFRPVAWISSGNFPRRQSAHFIGPEGFVTLECLGDRVHLMTRLDDGNTVFSTDVAITTATITQLKLTGDLDRDYSDHLVAVDRKMSEGIMPIYRPTSDLIRQTQRTAFLRSMPAAGSFEELQIIVLVAFIGLGILVAIISLFL